MKRAFDLLFSLFLLVIFSPLFFFISIAIKLTSSGPVFFKQIRVGKDQKNFSILKFRTMRIRQESGPLLTLGDKDPRITSVGSLLRKSKLDELPQLINIIKGDMSFVGPRPEVPFFVQHYSPIQKKLLTVRPGLTDPASIKFRNESELMKGQSDPESFYIKTILPIKLEFSLNYLSRANFSSDVKILFKTFQKIFSE